MSPLLTFEQFDATIPVLIAEADVGRQDLHPSARRDHEHGVAGTIAAAIRAVAGLVPFIEDTGGGPIYYDAVAPGQRRHSDVREEALRACAQLLEAAAAVRDQMPNDDRRARGDHLAEAVATQAFEVFSMPSGLPVWTHTWSYAVEQLADTVRFLFSTRLTGQHTDIGLQGAHDALESSAGATFCVLALLDAQRRARTAK